jgi:hypothetical protein
MTWQTIDPATRERELAAIADLLDRAAGVAERPGSRPVSAPPRPVPVVTSAPEPAPAPRPETRAGAPHTAGPAATSTPPPRPQPAPPTRRGRRDRGILR